MYCYFQRIVLYLGIKLEAMEMWHIWTCAAVVLFIIEVLTPAFMIGCIGIGAIFAAVAALCGLDVTGQLVFFAAGSLLSFFFIRPFVLKYLSKRGKDVKTNADAIVGRTGRVSQTIDNADGAGRVMVDGDDWKAVSADGSVIEKGAKVKIVKLDSIIITVKKTE